MPNLNQNIPQFIGANDNSPAWIMDAARRSPKVGTAVSKKRKAAPKATNLAWLFPVFSTIALAAAIFSGIALETLTSLSAIIGTVGLIWAMWCKRISAWRSRELSLLTSAGAFVLALFTTAILAGITLNTIDLALITAGTGLMIGFLYKSVPALLASVFAVAVWLFAVIPGANAFFGFGETASAGWTIALPVLLFGQVLLATHMRSTACLLLTIGLAYGWGIWLGLSSNIPLTALAGLGFAIGLAQHRVGKSMADSQSYSANSHSWIGAIVGLSTALYLQSVWLDPNMNLAVPGWIPTTIWWGLFGAASVALFISSLLRFKHSRITLSGIFILSAAASILPLASIQPDLVRDTLLSIPGLHPAPGFGLIIGAAIMAAGLAWIVNGLRTSRLLNIIIGAVLVGIQTLILISPGRTDLDTGIIFVSSLIAALCIGGLIAGAALDHSRPATRKL